MIRDMKNLSSKRRRIRLEREPKFGSKLRAALPILLGILLLISISAVYKSFKGNSWVQAGPEPGSKHTLNAAEQQSEKNASDIAFYSANNANKSYFAEDKVKSGDTFETILLRNSIDREHLFPILTAAKPAHNLNRVVVGRSFRFSFEDSLLTQLEYEIDNDRTLIVTRADSATWSAGIEETVYQVQEREQSGRIESSLYETVMEICSDPELALMLSEIYAWQIDFHNDIRKGDNFRVIYEEKIHPKGTSQVGRILAAVFNNDGKTLWAIRYTNADSTVDYFDLGGKSLRRKFLRSPFKYMPRISSRFSHRRFHPILKRYRPHLGIDYAAPTGTPVLALGDGKVVKRGWNGGFGHYILLRHNGMYSTSYGHLSRYARELRSGDRVAQGQVIGYVGTTGLSTGPHLDFRFYKNGSPVNPLTVDIPAGEPVHPGVKEQFNAYRDYMVTRLQLIGIEQYGPPLVASNEGTVYGPPVSKDQQAD
jgi:murein DD-endopeptidase MepM/ murein hydrolase activator NlpD